MAIGVMVLAAYYPAWHGGVLWDDDQHLTRPDLRSLAGLSRIWFDVGATQQYYPVTHSAFWLQHALWGDHTLGYHLVNILLHATSAFLLYRIVRRLAIPGAVLSAFVFALHPVHVESVAWITELKNTLSGVFCLAAALCWTHFDDRRSRRAYLGSLTFFGLALLSKTVTATLPAALLVLVWWRRGRVRWREDVAPLVPLFCLGLAAGLTTARLERSQIGAEGIDFAFSLVDRILIAGRAAWFYFATLLWPAGLTFIYPRWTIDASQWSQWLYPGGMVLVLVALWFSRRLTRAPLAAASIFIGTLFPALGFFNVYPFRYSLVADHFQYLASIPVIVALSAAIAHATQSRAPRATHVFVVTANGICAVLAALTWQHSRQYASAEVLYAATIERNPAAWMAHNNLAELKLRDPQTDLDAVVAHLHAALAAKPDYPEAHANLGAVYQRQGKFAEAAGEYRAALAANPKTAGAEHNLGLVLLEMGRAAEAIPHLERAVAVTHDPDGHVALANALSALGRSDEAIAHYRDALRLEPESLLGHSNLASLLFRLGRYDDAIPHLRTVVRLEPTNAEAHAVLGSLLEQRGELDSAVVEYQAAIAYGSGPQLADVHNALGSLLARSGDTAAAIEQFEAALRRQPGYAPARENLSKLQKVRKN